MQGRKIRIAFDAMGGDFAPLNELKAALDIKNIYDGSIELVLVGNREIIASKLSELGAATDSFEIVHAPGVITMHDDPTEVIKSRKDSSLYMGVELHRSGKVDAFVSAGNTGAMLSVSTILLGRVKGVGRPTIGSFFPTVREIPALVLDVGATVDPKPRFLYENAVMGSIYYKQMLKIDNPRVALLNVGEEETKGTEIIKETYGLLKQSSLNFIGNAEGRDIFAGAADVVVCDGFVGNIVLKLAESFISTLKTKIKDYSEKGLFNKMKVGLMVPVLKDILSQFDYQNYGGVPLLGVNGVVIIGHGKSTDLALRNMIIRAKETVDAGINNIIEKALTN